MLLVAELLKSKWEGAFLIFYFTYSSYVEASGLQKNVNKKESA